MPCEEPPPTEWVEMPEDDLPLELDGGNGLGSLLSDIQLFEQITRFKVIDQYNAVRIAADREAFLVGTQSETIELLDVSGADRA